MIGRIQLFSSCHGKKEGGTRTYILFSSHLTLINRMRFAKSTECELIQIGYFNLVVLNMLLRRASQWA